MADKVFKDFGALWKRAGKNSLSGKFDREARKVLEWLLRIGPENVGILLQVNKYAGKGRNPDYRLTIMADAEQEPEDEKLDDIPF